VKSSGIIKQSRSWQEFHTLIAALPTTKAKGDAFEALCAALLRTHPVHAAELRQVWLRSEVPPAIAARLNLPRTDEGIDGIAETRSGEFWSFQCKYLDNPRTALTKNALDGFSHLSFTYCRGITKALVLHTSAAPIRKHRLLGISEVGLREWEALDETGWKAINVAVRGRGHRGVTHEPRQPRPHQTAAVKAICTHLKTHDRGRVLMACGSGKSLVGFWVQEALQAKQVVVAVPSLSLLNQTLREWATEWAALGQAVRFTAVCGDESAADMGDSFVEHAHELGIDTYTDESRIAERLKALRDTHHVVFTTYQSSHRLAAAAKKSRHTFDLGILDEAHKTVVERGGRFATLLDERKVRIRKRVAMTATERILKGADDRVLSMSNPKVYGEVAFSYTFKAAIADGVICDYKVVTLAISESRVRELIAANKHLRLHGKGKADRLRLARDLAAGELLAKAQVDYGVRHAISFHRSIGAASGFAEQWEVVGGLVGRRIPSTAFHVSSKVPTGRRVETLKEFRNAESAVVTNARCLTEGVDVPNVDAVLFADPRKSLIDIVQAVGRALRKNRDKPDKTGYVLLPILVEDGQNLDEFLDSTAFKEVGRVLAVLSTHDERIAEEFRASEGGGVDRLPSESRLVFAGDVPAGVRLDAREFAAKCRAKVWERVGRVNWRPFAEAREWVRKLGLQNEVDWAMLCAGRLSHLPPKPADIPAAPHRGYAICGWASWGDWLGSGVVAWRLQEWRSFAEARAFARSLALGNFQGWADYCAGRLKGLPPKPQDIPASANSVYKDVGWIDWRDWLGVSWRSFPEARAFARGLNLSSEAKWRQYCRGMIAGLSPKPNDIPSTPSSVYAEHGWVDSRDWLGISWRSFAEARAFARSLALGNFQGWADYCAGRLKGLPPKPRDIPSTPAKIYSKQGWIGWRDWLGSCWRAFPAARAFVRDLKLKNKKDWKNYCAGRFRDKPAKPIDIPTNPHTVYARDGWVNLGDWLGSGVVAWQHRDWRSFTEARAFVRKLRLQSSGGWVEYCSGRLKGLPPKPQDIPASPNSVYKDVGWIDWRDWLGNERSSRRSRKRS
jgi:superfamily II DNA or RNA helicase